MLVARIDDTDGSAIEALRQLGARRQRTERRVSWRPIPLSWDAGYQRELAETVGRIRFAFAQLTTELPRLLVEARVSRGDDARLDVGEGKRTRALLDATYRAMMALIRVEDVEKVARKWALRVAELNARNLSAAAKAALGIELAIVTPHLGAILEQHVASVLAHVMAIPELVMIELEKIVMRALSTGRIDGWERTDDTASSGGRPIENAQLITGISSGTAAEVAKAVTRAQEVGDLSRTLALELEKRFAFATRRAQLIARDQLGKLTGQVNAARQKALGLTRFTWRSVHDQRVRPEHRVLDGKTFTWDKPPAEGLPGIPVCCRCYAEPMFDDLLDELEAGPAPQPKGKPSAPSKPAPPKPAKPKRSRVPKRLPQRGAPPAEISRELLESVDREAFARRGEWRPEDQRTLRAAHEKLLDGYGLGKRAESLQSNADQLVVRPDGRMGTAAALHETATGRITLGQTYANRYNAVVDDIARRGTMAIGAEFKTATGARRAELEDQIWSFEAMTHESIHGRGPHFVYRDVGVLVEEVATEMTSRRVTRDAFGLALTDHRSLGRLGGSYAGMIEGVTADISTTLLEHGASIADGNHDTAFCMLEDAALRYKQRRSATSPPVPQLPDEAVHALVKAVDFGPGVDARKAARMRKALEQRVTARRTVR